jgi:hypothetical protein
MEELSQLEGHVGQLMEVVKQTQVERDHYGVSERREVQQMLVQLCTLREKEQGAKYERSTPAAGQLGATEEPGGRTTAPRTSRRAN